MDKNQRRNEIITSMLAIIGAPAVAAGICGACYALAKHFPVTRKSPISMLNDPEKYIIEVLGKNPTKDNIRDVKLEAWDQIWQYIIVAAVVVAIALGIIAIASYFLQKNVRASIQESKSSSEEKKFESQKKSLNTIYNKLDDTSKKNIEEKLSKFSNIDKNKLKIDLSKMDDASNNKLSKAKDGEKVFSLLHEISTDQYKALLVADALEKNNPDMKFEFSIGNGKKIDKAEVIKFIDAKVDEYLKDITNKGRNIGNKKLEIDKIDNDLA